MLEQSVWLELITLGALVWLGYIGARLASRFKLPSVTGFLLVGVLLGPYGLGLLSATLLHKIDFVNTLALGLIVFLIGEQLTKRMLARHHWSFWLIAILSVALPTAFVLFATGWVRPGDTEIAWLLAAIAMSGAPATVMSVLAETKAEGKQCDMLLGAAAFSDIATVVVYASVVPILLVRSGAISSVGSAGAEATIEIVGAIGVGAVFGFVLAGLLHRTEENGELLSLGLVHVLLVVAVAHTLGVSALLAPLAMGITTAALEERRGTRNRCFSALRTVEYPVYIIFFTLAGAELNVSIVMQGGVLMLVYIVARAAGKFLAGFIGGLAGRLGTKQAAWFGLGSLPQAGVAVGLALAASQDFPDIGPTITAVVLASIVFFELVGPVATKTALGHLGCTPEACELEIEEGAVCRIRTVLIPVSHHWSAEKLRHILEATEDETECPSNFVLTHIVTPGRRYTRAEALARGERVLEQLAEVARSEGRRVVTRLVTARAVEDALEELAEEVGADLVVLGTPPKQQRGGLVQGFVRTPLHKIIDRLTAPVFIVPEDWQPRETSAHIASTVLVQEADAAFTQNAEPVASSVDLEERESEHEGHDSHPE